jgi:hypothetical protein
LRYTYEQHMADAARTQDLARARRLSSAFDALDPAMRAKLYPGRGLGQRDAPRFPQTPAPSPAQPRCRIIAPPVGHRTGMRWPFKILAGIITILAVAAAVGTVLQQVGVIGQSQQASRGYPRVMIGAPPAIREQVPLAPSPAQSWDPLQAEQGTTFIPSNAWVDPAGLAWLHCLYRDQPSELRKTLPGQWYTCPDNAVAIMIRVR